MAREIFEIEQGLSIVDANSNSGVYIIQGSGVPDGVSDKQGEAPIGSLYIRRGTGELYQKVANAGAASDYELNGGASIGTWRPEKIRVVSGDSVTSGVPRDLTSSPFSDDEGTQLNASDFTVGEFAILNNVLYEVTNVSAPNVTFTTAVPALAEGDTFVAINYLPDSPGDQEGQAIVTYNGSSLVKIADVDWNFADGISLAAGYAAGSGDITSSDTVQSAIQKLDGNNDAQDTLLGTSQGATNLGTFSGVTIPDSSTVKGALQSLETAHEEVDQNVNDLITLSGVSENATNLGTFTGSTISDNNTVKGALQELETAHESLSSVVTEIDQNVDDLITLSGVAENSTNLGTFTGTLFADNQTIKAILQRTEDLLEELKMVETAAITTQVAVDSVPVSSYGAVKWIIEVFEDATPGNKEAKEVLAVNDGTNVDFNVSGKVKLGANFNNVFDVDISGGNMRLLASSSTAGITVRVRRIGVVDI